VVTVALPAGEQSAVRAGQRVTVTLPDGSTAGGRILGAAPAAPPGQAAAGGPGGDPGGSGSGGPATVSILATLDRQPAGAGLDGAQVQVRIATQSEPDVLVAPISALLAGPGGRYQVTVVSGRTRRNVTVQLGLFDDIDGTVAVSGSGLTDGTRVEVPQP